MSMGARESGAFQLVLEQRLGLVGKTQGGCGVTRIQGGMAGGQLCFSLLGQVERFGCLDCLRSRLLRFFVPRQ